MRGSLPDLQNRDAGDGTYEGGNRNDAELTGSQRRIAQEPEEREKRRAHKEWQVTPVGATALEAGQAKRSAITGDGVGMSAH